MQTRPEELHPTSWTILRALRAGARLSRNKHFELFQDPRFRRALRTHRFLRSLARDIARDPEQVRVERVEGDDGWALRIDIPTLRGRRVAYLRDYELSLLAADNPELLAALNEAGGVDATAAS